MENLKSKKALVVGGARRLGAGIALDLARRGCDVAVNYRTSEKEAGRLCGEITKLGHRALAIKANVTDPKQVASLVSQVIDELGGVEILINCVGDYQRNVISETTTEQWRTILDSNLTAAFLTCREVIGPMMANRWGRIINLGFAGTSGFRARPGLAAYTAAKAALVSFTRSLALEVAAFQVTANVINLGYFEDENFDEKTSQRFTKRVPVGRLGTDSDLTALVAYLASDQASYLTGNALELTGGFGV